MKKVTTNTLATLVLVSMMSLTSLNVSAINQKSGEAYRHHLKRLERVYQYHDRKHELRASVLGISAEQLRNQLKEKSFDTIIKKHGFKNRQSFYTAVTGKLKEELRRRGWSERKIEEFVQKRVARLSQGVNSMTKTLAFSV